MTTVSDISRRRTFRGEEAWFPLLGEVGPAALRSGLIAAEVAPAMAGNLVWFLHDQMTLDRSLSEHTRSNYRKILATLDVEVVAKAARRALPGLLNSAPLAA